MRLSRMTLLATASLAIIAMVAGATSSRADDVSVDKILHAEKNPGDWLTYHGGFNGWHHSQLDQINTKNVGQLKVAWIHQPGRTTRGVQSMPLAVDGVLYYSGSYSKVYALDGATGEVKWAYTPELDEDLVARQTHSPYNRGMAVGGGNLYVGTVDGRLIALDMKTGTPSWDTKLIDSPKLTVGFTGAPLFVKDKVIIGSQGGEWPAAARSSVDAKTGKKVWESSPLPPMTSGEDLGQRAGAPAAAAAGCPAPTTPRPIRCGGAPPIRRRSMTGAGPTGRPRARAPATTSTQAR